MSTSAQVPDDNTPAVSNFTDIDADNDLERVTVMESDCLYCGERGELRMLLTRIPYFRDIILMSFQCMNHEQCNARYTELQPANELQPTGVIYSLFIDQHNTPSIVEADLKRQIIKSDTAIIRIPEIQFELPSSGRGEINTVEGIVQQFSDNIRGQLPHIESSNPSQYTQLNQLVDRLNDMSAGKSSFTLEIDDPAGNSYIENPVAPNKDLRCKVIYYERTAEQVRSMGFQSDDTTDNSTNTTTTSNILQNKDSKQSYTVDRKAQSHLETYFNVTDRAAILPGICHNCHQSCETRMCVTELPHFKDCVLMVTECIHCGYKDSEVKPAGTISDKALKIILQVNSIDDLGRDILKSDTASIEIPELELELQPGTLGAKYTTIEGILLDIRDQLSRVNAFSMGDSSTTEQSNTMNEFITRFNQLLTVEKPFTFIMDDAMGNIYIYNPHVPKSDPQLQYIEYERSAQQNDELGLNDLNVDPDTYLTDEHRQLMKLHDEQHKDDAVDVVQDDVSSKYKPGENDSNTSTTNDDYTSEFAKRMPVKIGGLIPNNRH